jgi:hypothetical protein
VEPLPLTTQFFLGDVCSAGTSRWRLRWVENGLIRLNPQSPGLGFNLAKTSVWQYIWHIETYACLLLVANWEEIVGKWQAEKEVKS